MKHKLVAEIYYEATCPEEVFTTDQVRSILISELDEYGMLVKDVVVKEDRP